MIAVDVQGQLSVSRKLELLRLPPIKRKRLLGQIARKLRSVNRKRLRQQRNVDGSTFAKRADGSKRRMFKQLGKTLRSKANTAQAEIAPNNSVMAKIAYKHHHGIGEVMTTSKAQKIYGEPNYDAPATRRQARSLKAEGYKARKPGGRFKRVTIKHITETMTVGQAGLVLRLMRDEAPKSQWVIPLPARDMLGAGKQDINDMVNTVFDQTIRAKA